MSGGPDALDPLAGYVLVTITTLCVKIPIAPPGLERLVSKPLTTCSRSWLVVQLLSAYAHRSAAGRSRNSFIVVTVVYRSRILHFHAGPLFPLSLAHSPCGRSFSTSSHLPARIMHGEVEGGHRGCTCPGRHQSRYVPVAIDSLFMSLADNDVLACEGRQVGPVALRTDR
ncbi:hypothetical protein J6590_071327 [Homalodisca vitripennis]|nr:hypothetical protein J6590_071327 [Homalodisca vitripennis]